MRKYRRKIIRQASQKTKKKKVRKSFLARHNVTKADVYWMIEIASIWLFLILEAIMIWQGRIMIMQGRIMIMQGGGF